MAAVSRWEEAPFWALLIWASWMLVISHVLLAVRVITKKGSKS